MSPRQTSAHGFVLGVVEIGLADIDEAMVLWVEAIILGIFEAGEPVLDFIVVVERVTRRLAVATDVGDGLGEGLVGRYADDLDAVVNIFLVTRALDVVAEKGGDEYEWQDLVFFVLCVAKGEVVAVVAVLF